MKTAMQTDEDEETPAAPATTTVSANGTTTSTVATLTPEEKLAKAEAKAAKEAAEKIVSDEKARVREVRVKALVERLRTKISVFTEQAQGEDDEQIANGGEYLRWTDGGRNEADFSRIAVRTMWAIEAEELKDESYGVELLQTVGFVYASKSRYASSLARSLVIFETDEIAGITSLRLDRYRSDSEDGSTPLARPHISSARPYRPFAQVRPSLVVSFLR